MRILHPWFSHSGTTCQILWKSVQQFASKWGRQFRPCKNVTCNSVGCTVFVPPCKLLKWKANSCIHVTINLNKVFWTYCNNSCFSLLVVWFCIIYELTCCTLEIANYEEWRAPSIPLKSIFSITARTHQNSRRSSVVPYSFSKLTLQLWKVLFHEVN